MHSSIEDDDIFSISPNSPHLAELFESTSSSSGNVDLMYTAPKQPKNNDEAKEKLENLKAQNTVIFAQVVQVYKTVNKTRREMGKFAVALVSDSQQLKEIILYKDKQNILTRANIKYNFEVTLKDDYASFYDNKNDEWHVHFEEEKYLIEYLDKLKKGNIKISEIMKETQDDKSSNLVNMDNSIKRDDNYTEELSVSQSRANILSRVAKMGQSIFPSSSQGNQFDSEDFSSESHEKTIKNKTMTGKGINNYVRNNEVTKSSIMDPCMTSSHLAQVSAYTSEHILNPQLVSAVIPSTEFNLFVSENRIQNSEIRINLTTLSSKLDDVIQKISQIKEPINTDKLENQFLKSKIADLEMNINELIVKLAQGENSTKYLELEKSIKQKEDQIENEKRKIIELQTSLRNIEDAKEEINDWKTKKEYFKETIHSLNLQLRDAKKTIEESHLNYTQLQEMNKKIVESNQELRKKIEEIEMPSKTDCKLRAENLEHRVKSFSDEIKNLMNIMFNNIISQLDKSNQSEQYNGIKNILSSNIKQTTLSVIKRFKAFIQTDGLV